MADEEGLGKAEGDGPPSAVEAFSFLPDGLQGLAEGYSEPSVFWADVSRLKALESKIGISCARLPPCIPCMGVTQVFKFVCNMGNSLYG